MERVEFNDSKKVNMIEFNKPASNWNGMTER